MRPGAWSELAGWGETFTCYSSALAAWLAAEDGGWAGAVDAGLHLLLTEEGDGLFGFSHFPPDLGPRLGLARRGTDDQDGAAAAIRHELEAGGRVIVNGDGFRLPWHVAFGRRHVPHWFTLLGGGEGPELVDPFECRTELGWQRPTRQALGWGELPALLEGLPGDDPVLALREAFALGADDRPLPAQRCRWLAAGQSTGSSTPVGGTSGPEALRRLARHFEEAGSSPKAYRQADDLWSIARHRAFFARRAGVARDADRRAWAERHLAPLVARWAHVAPLLMQARLGVEAARAPSSSVPDALFEIADREAAVSASAPSG